MAKSAKARVSMVKAAMQEMTDDMESRNFSVVSATDMERQQRADEKALADLDAKHRVMPEGIYDGTNLAELIEEERASMPQEELAWIDTLAFTIGCFGIAALRKTAKAITIKLPDGTRYRVGGNELSVNEVLPPTIKLNGTIRIDRFGKTAGFAFVDANGKKRVFTLKATNRIWLGKVVPLGTTAEGIDLSK
jgi:hypothetical protein